MNKAVKIKSEINVFFANIINFILRLTMAGISCYPRRVIAFPVRGLLPCSGETPIWALIMMMMINGKVKVLLLRVLLIWRILMYFRKKGKATFRL